MTIKQRQLLLAYLGYYNGKIDGVWGKQSKTATTNFQIDFGIASTGTCNEETEKALKHAVAYGLPEKKDFWDGIKHFKKSEFKCKCGKCGGFPVDPKEKLLLAAEKVRTNFGKPVFVTSGVRCEAHNKNVGGVSNSRHLSGKAMDFSISGMSAALVLPYVQSLPEIRYAYAIDSQHVHMDID